MKCNVQISGMFKKNLSITYCIILAATINEHDCLAYL